MSNLKTRIVISAVDQLSAPVRRMRAKVERLQETVGNIKEYQRAHRAMLEHKRALAESQAKTAALARAMREGGGATRAQARAFEQARKQTARLKQSLRAEQEALERMRRDLRATGVDTRNLAAEQARLERKTRLLSRAMRATERAGQVGRASLSAVGRVARYGAAGVGLLAGAVAGLARGMNSVLVRPAAQFEQFRTVLETIEGSSAKARASMDWIQDFAATTPFELTQVTDAFVKLRAYGLDPTNGLLRTLGDTASAMGKPLDQAVEAIADATTGEYERLKEFGIKAFTKGTQTAFQYTDRNGKQMTRIVDNRNRAMIQSTLEAIWNEKYAGAMEKQSRTWNGMMSNLSDWWTKFVNMVMDAGAFDAIKAKLASILDTIRAMSKSGELARKAREIGEAVVTTVNALWAVGKATVAVFRAVGRVIDVVTTPVQKLFAWVEKLSDKLLGNTVIGNWIGKATAALMAGLGSTSAQEALDLQARREGMGAPVPTIRHLAGAPAPARAEVGGTLHIRIDSEGRPRVQQLERRGDMDMTVDTGLVPAGAG